MMTEQRTAVVEKKKLPARKISFFLEIYTFLFDVNFVGAGHKMKMNKHREMFE